MRSYYEDTGLSRIALGLQTWPRAFLRNGRPSDVDQSESAFSARNWWDTFGTIGLGAATSTFTQIAEARFAGLTADVRVPAAASVEPSTSEPVVLLGSVPSAAAPPTTIGSSTPPPAVAAICGCGYFLAPMHVLDQLAANATHVHLSGQTTMSGGADFLLSQTAVMGASVSADMSVQNVAPIRDWQLVGGGTAGTETGQVGIMSGSVTTATAPSSTTTTSSNFSVAATSTNKIVLENQKQGTPQSVWDIDGAGSSNIEGFATDISVNVGNTVDFKINTDSSNYRIEIYRLGYYGGMGARLVDTIQHTGVQNQPAPLSDATTGLVDAGNWSVSASWNIPADSVSGVYIAKLVRQDGTFGENHIPFIVRDDSSTSDIVFQTADMTWQAYNGWGGANFYGGNGPATGQGAGRAYAVSYNRPIATRGGVGTVAGPQDYLFGAEYAAIYWLEENGYDVSYMAGVDVDRYGSLLLNHKMYLDVGHDEYWSGQQRANVQAARDAGVNLSFWSGNEMYWRTRWGDSISSDSTAYRTLISYKETWSPDASIDPSDEWTGTFRDPRLNSPATGAGIPENALIGQMFQVDDVGQYNLKAITIPYELSDLRIWRNTSVADLQAGQTATLTQNYLGYEWDEAVDNGFDPAGLVRLSSTTLPVNTYLLDYGNTTGDGVSTHSLTLYRAPSGALVFGAGTVYWSWGLSDNHDLAATPTDPRVQQAMVNLLADMGIQPGTLQQGLIAATASTDHTAPTSTINPIASFAAQRVVTISGTASDLGGGVVGGVEVSTDGGLTWYTAIGDENWSYAWSPQVAGTYTIKTRAVDDSINLETPTNGITVIVTPPSYVTLFSGAATPDVVNTTDSAAVELGVKFQTSTAGTISGIRFYKSSQDVGTHTGQLWSSTGTLLATATFTNETANGWQSVTFSNPVTLTAGATYVASYHTNSGRYSHSSDYFTSNVTSGPLTAPAAGNGVYVYSGSSAFPSEIAYAATNFWVDVMFNPATGNTAPIAVNDSGLFVAQGTPTIITASSLISNDSDPDGDGLTVVAVSAASHGTVVLNTQENPQNNTITFTPESGYNGPASFTYTVSDGRGGTASATVSFNVAPPGSAPVSLFDSSNVPALTSLNDGSPIELGMKFTSSVSGQITALKFYRSSSDTGVDGLSLWTSTGTQLANVTFTNTSASGWQTVSLPAPISISANTTYVASYHTGGAYVATGNFFTSAITNGPLTAPSTSAAGGNGLYVYGGTASGIFPTNTFNGANYWVDVVFTPSSGTNTAPTAISDAADAVEKGGVSNGAGGSNATGNVLTNDADPDAGDTKTVTAVSFGATAGTLGSALAGTYGSLVLNASGVFVYTINESNSSVQALRLSTNTLTDTFTYTMRDAAGVTSSTTLTVTIHGNNDAPILSAQTNNQSVVIGSTFSLVLPSNTFTDVDSGDSLTYSATLADGSPLPVWLSFDALTRTFTGTPPAIGTTGVRVTVVDAGGLTASETFNVSVTANSVSLFSGSEVPAILSSSDSSQVNLGVRFASNSSGTITGIKYYKGANDTGTHTGSLWSSTGTLLATATFTNETASGWQTVTFSSPVAISAGTTYVASYHSNGRYAATGNYFATDRVNGPLTAPASSNGVYVYGSTNLFPTSSFGATNYWVDVIFNPAGGGTNQAPIAVSDPGFSVAQNSTISIPASALLGNDSDPDGDTLTITGVAGGINGSASFNAQSNTVTFTPTAGYTGSASFTYAISDGRGGTASAVASLSVNAAASVVSLFSSNPTPNMTSVNDPNSVELGFKFQSSTNGDITGLRFYKGASNTGTHVANLWTSTGTLLATATFTNETATGWQQVDFATPVTIASGTTYVASYHTSGNYAADPGLFNSAISNGPLTAPSSATSGGNGLYAYGSSSLFPDNSYNSTSYGVDVMFRPQIAA